MADYNSDRDKLTKELTEARRYRESPVFTSNEEFRILDKINALDRARNRFMEESEEPSGSGPFSHLPDVDM